jgi:hypothetical protein
MWFLLRCAFWLGIVFYYLPADETKAPTARSKAAAVTSKPAVKTSADKRQPCVLARCATENSSQDTLKLSDFESARHGLTEPKDRLRR